jgi:acetylornithine deacetylase/succinyl-diaminopimelate desuccinylase-like protein
MSTYLIEGPYRMQSRATIRLLLFALAASSAFAQTNPAARAAREWRQQQERAIVDEFFSLLAIPNVARDRENIRRNADFIAEMLRKRGVAAKLLSIEGANPLVFGEIRTPAATRTLVFYAHYDGQPFDLKEWATPPFSPVLRSATLEQDGRPIPLPAVGTRFDPESRIYARSASDDKAPIAAMAAALDAIRAAGLKLRSHVKFVFEGEEEAGSTNLEKILTTHKQLLAGDVWLICDGPVHQSRRPLIDFGARGIVTIDITTYGARRELHSGHYGNWAPNPAMQLARLLASMKDDTGRVLIGGFYDGIVPLTPAEKRALAEAPPVEPLLMRELWLGSTEGAPKTLNELLALPSLNIRGMASSRTGSQASNVIPSTATASLDIRLVKGMDHRQTAARVIDHVRKQGFFITDTEPTADIRMAHPRIAQVRVRETGYNAVRTSMDLPISQEIIRTLESAVGPAVKLPTMGGSVPLEMIERATAAPTILIHIANHDNNQHSSNENLRIQNLWDGIELMAALLTM